MIATKLTSKSTNGALERGHQNPGDCILMDQYQVAQSGQTLNLTKGTLTHGAIFVDHASGRMIVHHQESLRTKETLVGKRRLDCATNELGFKIKRFVADNGIFCADEFL